MVLGVLMAPMVLAHGSMCTGGTYGTGTWCCISPSLHDQSCLPVSDIGPQTSRAGTRDQDQGPGPGAWNDLGPQITSKSIGSSSGDTEPKAPKLLYDTANTASLEDTSTLYQHCAS